MSILVVLLPPRERSGEPATGERAVPAPAEYAYVLSTDGLNVVRQGRATPVLLPKADVVIAWVGATEISWHRATLPRAPAAKLRAALVGVLEEQLLDDEAAVHLAVAAEGSGGSPT
jgi:general secretion pathway protein L